MASSHFARSLRAALPSSTSSVASSSRSIATTASLQAPKKAANAQAQKVKRKTSIKKNAPSGPRSTGAKRKGVSATDGASSNALSTPFYRAPPDLSGQWTKLSPDSARKDNVDTPLAFTKGDLEAFETCGVEPKVKKALSSYVQPISVLRSSTLDLYTHMDSASTSSSSSARHHILSSSISTGKSYLLLQSISYALASQWCVIYLPRLINWVNSTSPFSYSAEEQAYLQPEVVQKIMASTLAVNAKSGVLGKIPLARDVPGTDFKASGEKTVQDLLKAAPSYSSNPLVSQRIFDAFLHSISSQSAVPTLLAMDDAQALYSTTNYRDPDYKVVQAYELAAVRSILSLLVGGEKAGLKKGMVLAALSRSHSEWQPGNEIAAVLAHATKSSSTSALNGAALHAYSTMKPLHLEHAKRSNWTPFALPEQWTTSELKALFDVRRVEGRGWNAPAAAVTPRLASSSPAGPPGARGGAAVGSFDPLRGLASPPPATGRKGGSVGSGAATEDELFMLRVVDSARNPYRFDRALKGGSIM
ncbi:hypothetical protein BDZ90DRAFT_276882 [Jaminaea rosea]|uniref:Small ribosomal subunit protein mS29 n=1 Tax=Jaminaea rosea TaxID=1569628 RepID=A0A316UYN0_9BASI|nr:hypothetical protein BDZ90DRAFT_276882 [Jaminaea rosea]PWN30417.1 hypothetical protein BDZ90DRAFT_276882 [Jaminaea rosea]